MKNPFAKVGIAATLAAGLILAPGLSPAQASTPAPGPASSISIADLGPKAGGGTMTTYGMWFLPCDMLGFRFC